MTDPFPPALRHSIFRNQVKSGSRRLREASCCLTKPGIGISFLQPISVFRRDSSVAPPPTFLALYPTDVSSIRRPETNSNSFEPRHARRSLSPFYRFSRGQSPPPSPHLLTHDDYIPSHLLNQLPKFPYSCNQTS